MVDFHVGEIDGAPLTPPGPEMRKRLEDATPTEEIDMSSEAAGVVTEEKKASSKRVSFLPPPLSPPSLDDDDDEPTVTETVDGDEVEAAPDIPVVLSSSGDPIAVFEDKNDSSSEGTEEGEESSSEESSSEESSSEESSSEESSSEGNAVVAAAAVGAATAGGAAAAASADKDDLDVEIGVDPTETETAVPPESLENDIVNPDDMGERINLADEEYLNEVVPQQQDEEQGLLVNTDDSVADAPLSPITEKSVEKDDPSFSSAATAKASGARNGYRDDPVSGDSCCKRHKSLTCFIILMILFVIAAVVLVLLFLLGPLKYPASQEKKTATDRCEVVNLGPFYQYECESCSYTVAMDSVTGVISSAGEGRGDEKIQFLSNAGTYVPGQNLPYILHEASAVSGNFAALGERHAGNGTVYMYEKNSTGVWNNVRNITPATLNVGGESGAEFGNVITFHANKMVIGAPGDVNENGVSTGSVYVYGRGIDGNWVAEAKLFQNVEGGRFGSAVAFQGDTLVVSDSSLPGDVFVYEYENTTNSWMQPIYGLSSMDCADRFGHSVGVTGGGGILVECAMEKKGTGAVYYFTPSSIGSGYELSQKITAFNNQSFPELGEKIIVDNDYLLITTGVEKNGVAFVFELDGGEWKEAALIAAPAGANYFGIDAAFSGEHIFLSYRGNTNSYTLKC